MVAQGLGLGLLWKSWGVAMAFLKQIVRFNGAVLAGVATLLLLSAVAFAVGTPRDLPGPPAKPSDSVNDPAEDKIACGNLMEELERFRELHYENGDAVAGFVQAVGTHMWDWMEIFNQLAGQTVTFRREYFAPIEGTASTSDEISEMIYENTDQLDQRLQRIADSLEVCL